MLIDVAIPGDRNVIQKEPEKILKYIHNRDTAYVEFKNQGDTSNNRSDWNHFEINQKIREHHTT
jgi:hypothetical protein